MFKKNEGYKSQELFGFVNQFSTRQMKLWIKSKEHVFFKHIFQNIDEQSFSVLYSKKISRPNVPGNQLVGALILKHLNNWTYESLFSNLHFHVLTRLALGISNSNQDVFSEASIFNFQNKLIVHYNETGEDLISKVFESLTAGHITLFNVDTSIQRGDSFLIGSNITDYSRIRLLVEILIRLNRILSVNDRNELGKLLENYTTVKSNKYVRYLEKKDIPHQYAQLGEVYSKLHVALKDKYKGKKEFIQFERVLEEQFEDDGNQSKKIRKLQISKSATLLSPDDDKATYRRKGTTINKGYVGHISETVNKDNKLNLITDVTVEQSNMSDSKILEKQLPKMIKSTPDLNEYFIDGGYGGYALDLIAQKENIALYQTAFKGRKSHGQFQILEKQEVLSVSCGGKQNVKAKRTISTRKKKSKRQGWAATFDISICKNCPLNKICDVKQVGGIHKPKSARFYFSHKEILAHARFEKLKKLPLKKQSSRANVEATVKEMKRGMKNHKLRIRNWSRISLHMIFTALGVNLTRIHKTIIQKVVFAYLTIQTALHPNLYMYRK